MYDALIVVNGDIPDRKYWKDQNCHTLISTDGALTTLHSYKITPDVIIGDLDSISESANKATVSELKKRFPTTKICLAENQNLTDFEKTLEYAYEQHHHTVLCVGVLGKSADHSSHNLIVCTQYARQVKIMLLHVFDDTQQWIFPVFDNTTIYTEPGNIISFIPFPEATLTFRGLKWELQNQTLSHHSKGISGVRNITTNGKVVVDCKGMCICFLTAHRAPQVFYQNTLQIS